MHVSTSTCKYATYYTFQFKIHQRRSSLNVSTKYSGTSLKWRKVAWERINSANCYLPVVAARTSEHVKNTHAKSKPAIQRCKTFTTYTEIRSDVHYDTI